MVFLSRRAPQGPGRFLDWKIRLFFVGAAFFLAALALHKDLLVIVAVVVLVGAFALRFFEKDEEEPEAEPEAESTEDEESPADEP